MARYKFLNINPLNLREKDCVCRAISLALNKDYYEIEKKLELVAELFDCEMLCKCCYSFLLDDVFDLERIEEVRGMTVEEFSYKFPKGVYIIRVEGHCTCVIDSVCYDTWDATQEIVDLVWKVE